MAKLAFMLPRLALYGGVEQFAYRLAEAVAEYHEIDFICSRVEVAPPLGVRAVVIGRFFGFKFLKVFWYLLQAEYIRRKGSYDLVIGFGKTLNQDILRIGGGPQKIFWKLSEKAWSPGIPRWSKRFRRYLNLTNWLIYFIDQHQLKTTEYIICVSKLVQQWIVEEYPKVHIEDIIYNLPDLKAYTPTTDEQKVLARATYNINLDQIVIGTATSNFALKGTKVLIQSLSYLPENYILLIAGGRNATYYKNIVRKFGLQDRVFFMGKVEDMLPFYRALDIFVLPTYYDACSNAVLEARACGLRVLSSIYNGSSIFLSKQCVISRLDDPKYLAEQIRKIIHAPDPGKLVLPKDIKAGLSSWIDIIESSLKKKEYKIRHKEN